MAQTGGTNRQKGDFTVPAGWECDGAGKWDRRQSLLFSRDRNRQRRNKPAAPGLVVKLTTGLEEVKMMPCKKAPIPDLPRYLASAATPTALVSWPEPQEKVGIWSLAKGTLLEVG